MPVNIASIWGDWSWEPSVILGCLVLAGAYLEAAGPWRRRWLRRGRLAEAPISKGKRSGIATCSAHIWCSTCC
jgi:hypothetical protein